MESDVRLKHGERTRGDSQPQPRSKAIERVFDNRRIARSARMAGIIFGKKKEST